MTNIQSKTAQACNSCVYKWLSLANVVSAFLFIQLGWAQAPEPNAAKRQAPPRSTTETQVPNAPNGSLVPSVLRMIKLRISDATILRTIQPKLKGQPLSAGDIVRIAEGGASPDAITLVSPRSMGEAGLNQNHLPCHLRIDI
jgi:hypothetical protein